MPGTSKRPPPKSAAPFIPERLSLTALKEAAATCTGCDLYRYATQTVFGEGPPHAGVVFVGEQPGDLEDLAGRPFVGPAGHLLKKALAEVGLAQEKLYVTNAVKHFKWEPQGKRRKHVRPLASEVAACRPWLDAELRVTRPKLVVGLGVIAAQALIGRAVRLGDIRGKFFASPLGYETFITAHPASLLRAPDKTQQEKDYALLIKDLRAVRNKLDDIDQAADT